VGARPRSNEAIATVHAAIDAGITLIDTAPSVPGLRAGDRRGPSRAPSPPNVRNHTKCQLGEPPPGEAEPRGWRRRWTPAWRPCASRAPISFFLHSNIRPDDYVYARFDDRRAGFATPWSLYVDEVVPAMET